MDERLSLPAPAVSRRAGLHDSWWLDESALPYREIWARLRVAADGTADVLDCDGKLHAFRDAQEARYWLAEDEYRPLEHLIEEGELPADTPPPAGGDDATLLKQMVRVRVAPPDRRGRTVSLADFVLRLFGCLAVGAATTGLYAAWEATPAGAGRVWLLGASLLAVPVLLLAGELISNPILGYLEDQAWWARASSAVRIAAGVVATLPLLAFLAGSLSAFRRAFGDGQ